MDMWLPLYRLALRIFKGDRRDRMALNVLFHIARGNTLPSLSKKEQEYLREAFWQYLNSCFREDNYCIERIKDVLKSDHTRGIVETVISPDHIDTILRRAALRKGYREIIPHLVKVKDFKKKADRTLSDILSYARLGVDEYAKVLNLLVESDESILDDLIEKMDERMARDFLWHSKRRYKKEHKKLVERFYEREKFRNLVEG